jgi:hypothetical protein
MKRERERRSSLKGRGRKEGMRKKKSDFSTF